MPDKPLWLARLPEVIRQLEENPAPWIDRRVLESVLGVGRRRAQQLLARVSKRRVGTSAVADRSEVVAYLKRIAGGEEAYYESRRRHRLWARLSDSRREWIEQPPVLVELTEGQIRQVELHEFAGLPEGVELAPGSITVRFREPDEALRKLMALALAISQNREEFDRRVELHGG
jgi:hypothetical protein